MKVLVACEFSGTVRNAFRELGHLAYSCDLIPTESVKRWHFQCDVLELLKVSKWDLMIAHPPCTYLAVSGARWFKYRREEQNRALQFVQDLMGAKIPRIAVENPKSVISTKIRKPDQILQPWQFGHGEVKGICLWLKNLPKLKPTDIKRETVARIANMAPGKDRRKERSRTYPGFAKAMAEQWGSI